MKENQVVQPQLIT
jgi:hypothetical protein